MKISWVYLILHFSDQSKSSLQNYKEAIEREVDKLLAEKPKNCMEQVTMKKVQSAI